MIKCPITYFEKNLIFNDNGYCWAGFKMEGFNYAYLGDEAQLNILNTLARLIGSFQSMKILIVPAYDNIDEHFRMLKKTISEDNPVHNEAKIYLDLVKDELKAHKSGVGYTTYILVKLVSEADADPLKLIKGKLDEFLKAPFNSFMDFMTMEPGNIPLYKYKRYREIEGKCHRSILTKVSIERIQAGDIQWLLKKPMYRGINKNIPLNKTTKRIVTEDGEEKTVYSTDWVPKVNKNRTYIRPLKRDIINMFSGEIKQGNRHIEIKHDDGSVSYQTFLSLIHIPDSIVFPGMEWLYMLQDIQLYSEIEVDITIKNIDYKEAAHEIGKKRTEINSQLEEICASGADINDEIMVSKQQTDDLESELKNDRLPLCETSITFCISSDNLEQMEIDADFIKTTYSDQNFILERSIADQMKLFMESIPGAEKYVKAYDLKLSPAALASGVFGVNNKLGDDTGFYIGTHGRNNHKVYLNPSNANDENKSSATTFYGNLGYGKSFNANLLLFIRVLFGAFALIFDPKSERSHWPEKLPILGRFVKIVTIDTTDEHKGKLDPFNIYRDDIQAASAKALSLLSDLFKISMTDPEFTVLTEALEKNKFEELPSMETFVRILKAWDKEDEWCSVAKNIARRIEGLREIGLTKLLFGNGTEQAITFKNRINILQIQGLKIPDPEKNKADYNLDEVISSLIMGIFGDFAKQFIKRIKTFKVILIDESWFFKNISEGVEMINEISRMGRSLNACLILNGHSVTDQPSEATRNTITYKFCFHTDSTDEAARMLEYMNLDVTPENIATLKNLENRQCMFHDAYGRVGILTFDAIFSEIIEAFNTTPKENNKADFYEEVETRKNEVLTDDEHPEAMDTFIEDEQSETIKNEIKPEDETKEENSLSNTASSNLIFDPKRIEYLRSIVKTSKQQ